MREVLELAGLCLVVAGAALLALPLGLVLAGAVLIGAAYSRPPAASSSSALVDERRRRAPT